MVVVVAKDEEDDSLGVRHDGKLNILALVSLHVIIGGF